LDRLDQYFDGNYIDGQHYLHCYNNASWSASGIKIINPASWTNLGAVNIRNCNDAVLDNISVSGYTSGYGIGILVLSSSRVNISNSNFTGNTHGVRLGYTSSYLAHNATIKNTIFDSNDNGIFGEYSDYMKVLTIGML